MTQVPPWYGQIEIESAIPPNDFEDPHYTASAPDRPDIIVVGRSRGEVRQGYVSTRQRVERIERMQGL